MYSVSGSSSDSSSSLQHIVMFHWLVLWKGRLAFRACGMIASASVSGRPLSIAAHSRLISLAEELRGIFGMLWILRYSYINNVYHMRYWSHFSIHLNTCIVLASISLSVVCRDTSGMAAMQASFTFSYFIINCLCDNAEFRRDYKKGIAEFSILGTMKFPCDWLTAYLRLYWLINMARFLNIFGEKRVPK